MAALSLPQLRPLSMGQIMDQAIRLYRRNFVAFVGIVALVQIPIIAVDFLITLTVVNTGDGPFFYGSYFGMDAVVRQLLSFILIQGLATAAMTRAVADNYFGEKTGSIEAFRKIGSSWLSLIGALFISGLMALVIFIWALVPIVGWLTGWAMLVYFPFVIVPLVAPVIVLERESAVGAWRRAWDLARQRYWWVIAFFLILAIFSWLVVAGPTVLLTAAFQFAILDTINDPENAYLAQTVVSSLITLLLNLIYLPFSLAAISVAYFDLRVRSEGLDLSLMAQDVGDPELKAADMLVAAPQANRQSLITLREFAYFAAITIVGGSLLFFLIFLLGLLFTFFPLMVLL
jgi:hypothetical protein